MKTDELKSEFRTHIHNLGSNIYQNDFALYWTIRLLYLVEYANWNSQEKIGYGADYSNTTGTTDSIPYHTGTIFSSRTTKGAGTQYRYIEGLWDTSCQIIDGIYFTQNGSNIYVIKNPNNFSDNSNGTLVGQRSTSNGGYNVISWTNPTVSGYEYALIPYTVNTFNQNTYSCDIY